MRDTTRLRYDEFVPFAPSEENKTVNIYHCKKGNRNDKLYITRKPHGVILAHCFHCDSGGKYVDKGSRHNGKKRTTHVKRNQSAIKRLPKGGYTQLSKWSPEARAWIDNAHIGKALIQQYGLTFYPQDDCVLLPVYSGSILCRVIRRSFGDTPYPKYYTVMHDNFHNGHAYVIKCRSGKNNTVVFVEDFLSAIRCAQWADSVPLFRTKLHDNVFVPVINRKPHYTKRIVFLDNDNINVLKAQCKVQRRLDTVFDSRGTVVYRTNKDPKNHSETELKDIIIGANYDT